MEALTDSLRMELAPWGISVIGVAPGAIATPIWKKSEGALDTVEAGLPAEAHALYGASLATTRVAARKMAAGAIPAERVAEVVARALLDEKPRARYVVGTDARVNIALGKYLPDRIRDTLIRYQLGLARRA